MVEIEEIEPEAPANADATARNAARKDWEHERVCRRFAKHAHDVHHALVCARQPAASSLRRQCCLVCGGECRVYRFLT